MNWRVVGSLAIILCLVGCKNQSKPVAPVVDAKLVTTDTVVGTGEEAKQGDRVWMNYTGKLLDGTVFDSNDGKEPFNFTIGVGGVIKGWDQGIPGMKVHGKRHLVIPASLAYGAQEQGKIPANSTLVFDVELLYVLPKGSDGTYTKSDTTVGTGPEAKKGDTVEFHYKAVYPDGKVFDDSEKRPGGAATIKTKLGSKEIVPVLDTAIEGMKVGGVRVIDSGPDLILGAGGGTGLKGDVPVTFTVKLVSVNGHKS